MYTICCKYFSLKFCEIINININTSLKCLLRNPLDIGNCSSTFVSINLMARDKLPFHEKYGPNDVILAP